MSETADYVAYDFDLSPSEKWRERPVILTITHETATGSAATSVNLDYDEMRRLSDHLRDYLNNFGPESSTQPAS